MLSAIAPRSSLTFSAGTARFRAFKYRNAAVARGYLVGTKPGRRRINDKTYQSRVFFFLIYSSHYIFGQLVHRARLHVLYAAGRLWIDLRAGDGGERVAGALGNLLLV